MDKRDIFKNVYEDFFGVESLTKRNEKLAKEIEELTGVSLKDEDIPSIEVENKKNEENLELDTDSESKNKYMKDFFEEIENLYIEDKSKELLKKIIEYMRKYDEKIEKQYISFNMCIYSDNKENINKITEILAKAGVLFSYIREGRGAVYSLYDVDEVSKIENIYEKRNNLVVVKDFEAFNTKEQNFKDRLINKLDEYARKNENEVITVFNAKNKEILKEAFQKDNEILQNFSDFEILGINPDVQDAYNDILEILKNNMEISDEFALKMLDYISVTYPNNSLSYPEYRDKVCQNILFNKEIPEYEKEKSMDEIFAELNSLVGLEKVKEMLKDLVNLIELKNKTKDDLKIKNVNLHMIFLGNPGTGKTTVARIVAEMLYNLKYVKQNKLIEVSSKDLVAEYVGQTAPKTMAVIQKALGGVLFIDEAYSLASRKWTGKFLQ